MAIQADCPECGNPHRVKDEIAGKKFACKKCGAAVRVPQPVRMPQEASDLDAPPASKPSKSDPEDFDWNAPLNDTSEIAEQESVEALPALPPPIRKKKKKPARQVTKEDDDDDDDSEDGALYRGSSSSGWMIAGMPVPIVISLGCNAVLWLWAAFLIYDNLRFENPWGAFGQILRICWLSWLIFDIANGAMRSRYLSILMSISGLTWAAVMWTVFVPLMALAPIVKEQPWLLTFAYFSVAFQATLWTTNIIALLMPSAAEHCSEWEGG